VRDLYKDPAQLLADNIGITTAVLKAGLRRRCPTTSSSRAHACTTSPARRCRTSRADTDICDTSYGFAKVVGEQLTKWYSRQYNFATRVARLFNVYGPGDSFQSPHVIPEFIRKAEAAKTSGKFEILGLGNQTRDFTHMDDCISGLLAIMERGIPGEAYNVGTGREISIRALAEMVCAEVGVSPEFTYEAVAKEDIQRRAADNAKGIRSGRGVGWNPLTSRSRPMRNQEARRRASRGVSTALSSSSTGRG
jgi:GDP-L-fucose synthase